MKSFIKKLSDPKLVFKYLKSFYKKDSVLFILLYSFMIMTVIRMSFTRPAILFVPTLPLHVLSYSMLSLIAIFSVYISVKLFYSSSKYDSPNLFRLNASPITSNQVASTKKPQTLIFVWLVGQSVLVYALFIFLNTLFLDILREQSLLGASYSFIYVRAMDILTAAFTISEYPNPLRGQTLTDGILASVWLSFFHMFLGFKISNLFLLKAFQSLIGFCLLKTLLKRIRLNHSFIIALAFITIIAVLSSYSALRFTLDIFLGVLFLNVSLQMFSLNKSEKFSVDFFAVILSFSFLYSLPLKPFYAMITLGIHIFFYLSRRSIMNKLLLVSALFLYLPFLYQYHSFFAENMSKGGYGAIPALSSLRDYFFPVILILSAFLLIGLLSSGKLRALQSKSSGTSLVISSSIFFLLSVSTFFHAFLGQPIALAAAFCAGSIVLLMMITVAPLFIRIISHGCLCFGLIATLYFTNADAGYSNNRAQFLDHIIKSYDPAKTLFISYDSPYLISKGYSTIPPDIASYFLKKIDYRIRYQLIEDVVVLLRKGSEDKYPDFFGEYFGIKSSEEISLNENFGYTLIKVEKHDVAG